MGLTRFLRNFSRKSGAGTATDLCLNRVAFEEYVSFRGKLEQSRASTPLPAPGYYPYASLELVPQILPILEAHGLDLTQYIVERTILDLGCGDGDIGFYLERLGPKKVTAIDWGPTNFNGLEGFRALKEALGASVELRDVDVHSISFDQIPLFHTILCLGFLYHSPHPFWVLQNLARRTNDLFLTTKVFDNEYSFVYFYDRAECNDDPTNWWCFTPKALERMLRRAGFRVILMERLDPYVGISDPVNQARDGRVFVMARSEVV